MKPVVFVIEGKMGVGKTEFAKAWMAKAEGALLPGPRQIGDVLRIDGAFDQHAVVAVDELDQYEAVSAKQAVKRLIVEAKSARKQLVLVLQNLSVITSLGIVLPEETAYCRLEGPTNMAKISYQGSELQVF